VNVGPYSSKHRCVNLWWRSMNVSVFTTSCKISSVSWSTCQDFLIQDQPYKDINHQCHVLQYTLFSVTQYFYILFVCFLQDPRELIKMPVGQFRLQSAFKQSEVLNFKQSRCFWYCLPNFQVCFSIEVWCFNVTDGLRLTVKV